MIQKTPLCIPTKKYHYDYCKEKIENCFVPLIDGEVLNEVCHVRKWKWRSRKGMITATFWRARHSIGRHRPPHSRPRFPATISKSSVRCVEISSGPPQSERSMGHCSTLRHEITLIMRKRLCKGRQKGTLYAFILWPIPNVAVERDCRPDENDNKEK